MIGKSIYIWQISTILEGDSIRIVQLLKAAGFESAILHSTRTDNWRTSERGVLAFALREAGIIPFGGAAVYGSNPTLEGQQAAAICRDYGLAGFIFDAESAFDVVPEAPSAAVKLLWAFKAGVGEGVQAGWCWWPLHHKPGGTGVYHPKAILNAAMHPSYGNADFGVPMMYWSWGDDAPAAVRYINESWAQWREVTDKPIYPAGRAYIGNGGTARPEAVTAFEARARELGAQGVTWWSLQHAIDFVTLPGVWNTLLGLPPYGQIEPQPEPEPIETTRIKVLVDRLNVRTGPGIFNGVMGLLFKGAEVKIIDAHQDGNDLWIQVLQPAGWVAAEYNGQNLVELS